MKRWLDLLKSNERRRAERHPSLPLVAYYYFDGGMAAAHPVRDMSLTGMYLATEQRWYPNTLVRMTVVDTLKAEQDADRSIQLMGRMVRTEEDGVGLAFVLPESKRVNTPDGTFTATANQGTLKEFLSRAQYCHSDIDQLMPA